MGIQNMKHQNLPSKQKMQCTQTFSHIISGTSPKPRSDALRHNVCPAPQNTDLTQHFLCLPLAGERGQKTQPIFFNHGWLMIGVVRRPLVGGMCEQNGAMQENVAIVRCSGTAHPWGGPLHTLEGPGLQPFTHFCEMQSLPLQQGSGPQSHRPDYCVPPLLSFP